MEQQTGLGLDVGEKRIGVAAANLGVRFAHPLTTLTVSESVIDEILDIVQQEDVAWVVIGLPRGLDGQSTGQTAYAEHFGKQLEAALVAKGKQLPVYWIDEALTSRKAEAELDSRGKPYAKGEIDALAATYILEDYLKEHPQG